MLPFLGQAPQQQPFDRLVIAIASRSASAPGPQRWLAGECDSPRVKLRSPRRARPRARRSHVAVHHRHIACQWPKSKKQKRKGVKRRGIVCGGGGWRSVHYSREGGALSLVKRPREEQPPNKGKPGDFPQPQTRPQVRSATRTCHSSSLSDEGVQAEVATEEPQGAAPGSSDTPRVQRVRCPKKTQGRCASGEKQ